VFPNGTGPPKAGPRPLVIREVLGDRVTPLLKLLSLLAFDVLNLTPTLRYEISVPSIFPSNSVRHGQANSG
jgi:hypothetical protein